MQFSVPKNPRPHASIGVCLMALENIYTTEEAARTLRLSKRTLLSYCRQGRISYVRLKGKFLFRESVLEVFVGRNSVPAKHLPPVSVVQRRAA